MVQKLEEQKTEDVDQKWQHTCDWVVKAVVSVQAYVARGFDTEKAGSYDATGFIVNAKEGIILTNRHVAGPGPFRGRVLLHTQEEVDVSVMYYDPIHDYGFLKFNPEDIKRTEIAEIPLRPDLAVVGLEIRVIGNDAAQKLSISEGTIGRVNRNAPTYSKYTDFNTNYIQGSAMTSGGSSGSPVIDINGNAVALNGGSFTNASVALFLPLEQPQKTFGHLLANEDIPRGTIQAKWVLQPFHEAQTLGVTDDWITSMQEAHPDETMMLVTKGILPEGPAHNQIEEGDVLLKVNGKRITKFNELTDILDANVSKEVVFTSRRGDEDIEVSVPVDNLHEITPDRFVKISTSIFHDFSFMYAQRYRLPVRNQGVYICPDGALDLESGGHLIQSIDGKSTKNLKEFEDVLATIPDGRLIRLIYKSLYDVNKLQYKAVIFDRRLCFVESFQRDFPNANWIRSTPPDPPKAATIQPYKAGDIAFTPHVKYPEAGKVINSIVWVTAFNPLPVDGHTTLRCRNFGLVVNEEKGLVLVSRDTVTMPFCRTSILFFGSTIIPSEVVFLHPIHHYAILRYDPSLIQGPIGRAKLSPTQLKPGQSALSFSCNDTWLLELSPTFVSGVASVSTSPHIGPDRSGTNLEYLSVGSGSGGSSGVGLISEEGIVQGLWLGTYCISTQSIVPILEQLEEGITPQVRLLGARLHLIEPFEAIAKGVPPEWIKRVEQAEFRQLFEVTKPFAGHETEFNEGDILLTLDDKLITKASEIHRNDLPEVMEARVLRNLEEMTLRIPTYPTSKIETSRILVWAGAIMQAPHLAVRQRVGKVASEVYIAGYLAGSPVRRFGVSSWNFITNINGTPTPDLDTVVEVTKKLENNKYFRVKGVSTQDIKFVKTLKLDQHYFPLVEYIRDGSEATGWKLIRH